MTAQTTAAPSLASKAGAIGTATTNTTTKLNRTLGFSDLVTYGLIFMIPVAPIAFYGSQVAGVVIIAIRTGFFTKKLGASENLQEYFA